MWLERSTRRRFLTGVAAAGAASDALGACLQARALRWIVPNPPGGGYDAYSRLVAPYVGRELGLDVRIHYEPGGAGLRGIRVIRNSRPQDAVLGLVNMPGALMSEALGSFDLDPARELTLLGTISRLGYYWAAAASSRLQSTEDVVAAGRAGKLVFGVNAASSIGFLTTAMAAALLGWDTRFVGGYGGSASKILALLRGEVDLIPLSWDVLVPRVRNGELRPLLAIDERAAGGDYSELDGVGTLTGPGGLISKEDERDATALVRFMQMGRIVVGPPGLDPATEACLGKAVCAALNDAELSREAAASGSALQPLCAEATGERIRAAQRDLRRLAPLARRVIADASL